MLANGGWDLIQRLKVKAEGCYGQGTYKVCVTMKSKEESCVAYSKEAGDLGVQYGGVWGDVLDDFRDVEYPNMADGCWG